MATDTPKPQALQPDRPVIAWLLDSDPSVRWQVLRDLTAAPAEEVAAKLWVALKHEITYRKPAFLDDELWSEVIPEGVEGARAFFSTVIRRGETVLAEVKSSWCCLDAATLRPSRIAGDVAQLFLR